MLQVTLDFERSRKFFLPYEISKHVIFHNLIERFKLEEKIASNTLLPEDSKIIFMIIITAFVIFIAYM